MKINLPDKDQFYLLEGNFCGSDAYLITPKIDAEWNENNLFYRSLVLNKEGNVLSSGWPKFFNYQEKPGCYPNPENFKDWNIQDKLDGSLVICDYVNGQFSMRTRGTFSYASQENAKDFELLSQKYPKVVEFLKENSHLSLLFEIVTPNNVIVIRPKEIEFYLLGAINKNGMCVVSSSDLLNIWRDTGCVPTPQSYQMDNICDLSKIYQLVKGWKGKEGIVICYNKNQNRIKLKSDWYLWIHRIKSQLNSDKNLIEFYVDRQMPSYDNFYKIIEKEFDFELAEQMKPSIEKVCEVGLEVKKSIENMKDFVSSIRGFENRKQQAQHILATYKICNRSSFVFNLLDGKELDNNQLIKLMEQTYGNV